VNVNPSPFVTIEFGTCPDKAAIFGQQQA